MGVGRGRGARTKGRGRVGRARCSRHSSNGSSTSTAPLQKVGGLAAYDKIPAAARLPCQELNQADTLWVNNSGEMMEKE